MSLHCSSSTRTPRLTAAAAAPPSSSSAPPPCPPSAPYSRLAPPLPFIPARNAVAFCTWATDEAVFMHWFLGILHVYLGDNAQNVSIVCRNNYWTKRFAQIDRAGKNRGIWNEDCRKAAQLTKKKKSAGAGSRREQRKEEGSEDTLTLGGISVKTKGTY